MLFCPPKNNDVNQLCANFPQLDQIVQTSADWIMGNTCISHPLDISNYQKQSGCTANQINQQKSFVKTF